MGIKEEIERIRKEREDISSNMNNIVNEVIKNNPKAVDEYKGGKEVTLGFLVGQVMYITKGIANPNEVKDILANKLNKEE